MINLREQIESDLKYTLEGEFGLPVELKDPDGNVINTDLNGDPLVGQILFDYKKFNPDTGEEVIINEPVISLRITSLSRIPKAGEKWQIRIPTSPSSTATLDDYQIDTDRPPEGGKSIGFIRLYPRKLKQA